MIDNNAKVGYYSVRVVARSRSIASFFCPTLADAKLESERIAKRRKADGLPTEHAYAREVLEWTSRGWDVGQRIELLTGGEK